MNRIKSLYAALTGFLHSTAELAFHKLTAYMTSSGAILSMANIYSQHTYDAGLLLKAAALVASTADGTLIVDVGTGLYRGDLVIDVTALEIDSNDESYEVVLQGSSDAAFGTAANIAALTSITVGDKVSTRLASGVLATGTDDLPGRYTVAFRNERNGTTYRYLRIKTIVVGTIATGINYTAFLAKS